MAKPKKPESFIYKPEYPGGPGAMSEFIRKNLKYPEEALKHKISGTVVLRIDINRKGSVTKATVKQKLGYGCDEEAIRVARMLKFNVKKPKGMRVTWHKTININFRLPATKPQKQTGVRFQYTITPSSTKGSSYNYTIGGNKKTGESE